jgi:hypothetical protein
VPIVFETKKEFDYEKLHREFSALLDAMCGERISAKPFWFFG